MTDINLSIPQFLFISYLLKGKHTFTMINTFDISEVSDDGEVIRLKLRNGSPRTFSEVEREMVIQQLMLYQVNNNKYLPKK